LRNVWQEETCKNDLKMAGLIDMPKNPCIMQILGRDWKVGSALQ